VLFQPHRSAERSTQMAITEVRKGRRVIAGALACLMLFTACSPEGGDGPGSNEGPEETSTEGPSPEQSAASVIRELELITDTSKREVAAVLSLNTLCSLSRVASGRAEGRVENAIAPAFSSLKAEAKTKIQRLGQTLNAIPAARRAQLMGRLGTHDPGACTTAPSWEAIRHSVIFSHRQVPRLRSNFCSGNFVYADGTRDNRAITSASVAFPNFDSGPVPVAPAASPVILGVEGHHVTARHPALAATTSTPIANGISPYGVETNISCSFTNDSCNASQGLVCGLKLGAGPHCIAFPVVQKDQDLVLRGYNYWDVESARLVFSPAFAGQGLESTAVVRHVDANEPADGSAACPVASAANPTHNRAHFSVSANEGNFYKLRLYNRNGSFLTQADALDDAVPRVLHVCYPQTLGPAVLPPGTVRDCTPPVETCPRDGATCAATWSTPPRKLDQCRHLPGESALCGETPEWFANERLTERQDATPAVMTEPMVFVIKDEPKFEFRASLQAVECKDETGADFLGSDEPMLLVAGFSPDMPAGADANLLKTLEDNAQAWHGEDFDSGDRKQVMKLLSTVRDLRFDSSVVYLVALMEDDSFLEGFLAGAAVIIATAAIIYLSGGTALLAAAGGAALGVGLWAPIMAGIGEDDLLGRTTLLVTPTLMDERIGANHTPDFLTSTPPFGALPPLPGAPTEKQRSGPALIHPFEDFKLRSPLKAQCDPGSCASGESCLVQLCVPPGFVDPTAGRGFRERREFATAGYYYAVDLLWEKVQVP
jgi:hypothetical protein